jgi:hypothetical protein
MIGGSSAFENADPSKTALGVRKMKARIKAERISYCQPPRS